MRALLIIIASCAFSLAQAEEAASNAKEKSIEELTATCVVCHGKVGEGTPDIPANPILAGQHRDYLLVSMQRYQNGMRKNAVMAGLVAGLSEKELKKIAAFYSKQDGLWDTAIPRFK